ncbi:hypothetical protein KEM52_005154 [Ascosphaera acerosa]|nr:hypothetical protein KEM52_005154 [Ascosphaera acerosa]
MGPRRASGRQAAAKAKESISKAAGNGRRRPSGKRKSSTAGKDAAQAAKGKVPKTEEAADATEEARDGSDPSPTKQQPEMKAETETSPAAVKEEPSAELSASDAQDLKKEAEVTFGGKDDEPPANIVEKGLIYFFFRGRVNIEEPESLDDVSRSFIVFRSVPLDSTLAGSGVLSGEAKTCRLVMLPKKVFPTRAKQRYMAFVEKANVDVQTIRDSFVASTYETKTRGERTTPAATPYAEGVYAFTHSKNTSHLAYVLTIPSHVDEIQRDFGLADKGSFVVASKNPKYPGPSFAQLPAEPDYPQEILDSMNDYRWVPLLPEHINYANAQIVIIGEAEDTFSSAGLTEEQSELGRGGQTAADELDKLSHVDEIRVEKLHGAEAIFRDLHASKAQLPSGLGITWA